jgi:hypothetical protein
MVVNKNLFGFIVSMDIHRETQKHRDLMELKTQDHESWKLALNEKTKNVKCSCGIFVCRWSMPRHQECQSHLELMAKKKAPKPVLEAVTTVVKHVEPLPEPTEDVKAFVAGYDSLIPQMIQCFDALIIQVEEIPLPRTSVDVEDWTDRLKEIIETEQVFVDALKGVTAPDPIPWEEIEQTHDPYYTTYKQMQVTQIIKHIVCLMDKRPGHKQLIKRAVDSFFRHLRVYKYSTFLDCIVDGKLKQRFDHDLNKEILRIHYTP